MSRFAKKCYILESWCLKPPSIHAGRSDYGKAFLVWIWKNMKSYIIRYSWKMWQKNQVLKMKVLTEGCDCKVQTAQDSNILAINFLVFSKRQIGLDGYCAADSRTGNKWEIIATAVSHFKGNWARKYSLMVQSTDSPCSNSFLSQNSTKTEFKHLPLIWNFKVWAVQNK